MWWAHGDSQEGLGVRVLAHWLRRYRKAPRAVERLCLVGALWWAQVGSRQGAIRWALEGNAAAATFFGLQRGPVRLMAPGQTE